MRDLVAARRMSPPMAARAYAYASVAVERALACAPTEARAILDAILTLLFQTPSPQIALSAAASRIVDELQARIATDGANTVWSGSVPVGPGLWTGTNPLLPLWPQVRGWRLTRPDQFRPPPPPAFGSRTFDAALAEVRHYSDERTPEQLELAQFWADGAGTSTPPGHWNEIAFDLLIRECVVDARFAAHVLATLNMALMDASICCWDAKYHYWLLRPSQADPGITTPVGLPNFPSYTSGHATFSGAAAEILGALLPSVADEVNAMAEEAALSRLYGGIHYRFDSDAGLEGGRQIAQLFLE